jgi:hypothetical protein
LPQSIKTIGEYCFCECLNLIKINIPDSLQEFPEECFYGYEFLTEVYLPQSIKTIGKRYFTYCHKLNTINIHDSIQELPEECFYVFQSLTFIIVPISVRFIRNECFARCSKLQNWSVSFRTIFGKDVFLSCAFYGYSFQIQVNKLFFFFTNFFPRNEKKMMSILQKQESIQEL